MTLVPALQPINIGDTLPSLTIKNEKGEDVDVSTLAAEKGVILFVVPKADTRGFHFCVADSKCLILVHRVLQLGVRPKHAGFATSTPTSPRPASTSMP